MEFLRIKKSGQNNKTRNMKHHSHCRLEFGGPKEKLVKRSVVNLRCATRATKAKLATKVGRLLLKRNLNV